MSVLKKIIFFAHRFEDGALVLALISMLLMALLQILLRNLFDSGFLWAESFLRILVLWIAMLGAMVATREGHHISIDLLSNVLKPGFFVPLRFASLAFASAISFTTAYYCIEFIGYEYIDGTIAFAKVPVWVCMSILPVGFGVMGLRFLLTIFVKEN